MNGAVTSKSQIIPVGLHNLQVLRRFEGVNKLLHFSGWDSVAGTFFFPSWRSSE